MPFSRGELGGHLDERLGLQLDQLLDVLGDVVLVLGEPVATWRRTGTRRTVPNRLGRPATSS